MTVEDLIAALQRCNPKAAVSAQGSSGSFDFAEVSDCEKRNDGGACLVIGDGDNLIELVAIEEEDDDEADEDDEENEYDLDLPDTPENRAANLERMQQRVERLRQQLLEQNINPELFVK